MGKITEAFGAELEKETLESFMRQEAVSLKFSAFCRGEASGRLFVFFQPEISEGEVCIYSRLVCRIEQPFPDNKSEIIVH